VSGELLADPVAETRQLISRAADQGLVMRWYAEPEQEQPGGE